MKYVLFYVPVADVATVAAPHFPAHGARLREFAARGVLEQVGTFENAQADGSMAIFTSPLPN